MPRFNSFRPSRQFGLFVISMAWLSASSTYSDDSATSASTERLLAAAAQAEIAGDAAGRDEILHKAIQVDPDARLVRWQLGELEIDDKWVAAEAAAQSATTDPRQIEYAALRASYGDTPEGQLALARWCEKKGLDDEASVHWTAVVSIEPNHEEALRALDAEWFNGQLLTREQVAAEKEKARRRAPTLRAWNARLRDWQRKLDGELSGRMAALAEIGAINEVEAIPVVERATLGESPANELQAIQQRHLSMAFLDALEKMAHPLAMQSLVRHAVLAPIPSVRNSAVTRLKKRPMEDFVPILLDGLIAPIESSFNVATGIDGSVFYTHSLYQAGRLTDWSFDGARAMLQRDLQGSRTYVRLDGTRQELDREDELQRQMRFVAASSRRRFGTQAVSVEQSLQRWNDMARARNELIVPKLIEATGQELGTDPRDWWSWWEGYSDRYYDGPKPVYANWYYNVENSFYGQPVTEYEPSPPRPRGSCECFAKGTLVWTKLGRRPIESLRIGDLVLSCNVDTGELGYKPIMATTIRPPSELLRLSTDNDQLVATRGHQFWLAGTGWRMARELAEGTVLHRAKGPARVAAIEPAETAEAYNLVVREFSTYFVGDSGVLVHDNSPIRPTAAMVPGVTAP